MIFSVATLAVAAAGYLLLLFLVAYAAERWLPEGFARHPLVYVLSLGVYATTWSYYGSVGFASGQGVLFLTIYLGVTLAFVLTPVLLMPLLRLVRAHQLTSLADLLAFRFDSRAAGVLVAAMMLSGVLPYIALQIRAVAEATQALSGQADTAAIAAGFCLLVTVFTILFGARHVTLREKHAGLVVAIAFESLVKLLALLVLAAVAVALAFGSATGLQDWLSAHPEKLRDFYAPGIDGPWASLLLITFAAGFLLPRQFHMTFTENLSPRTLLNASWGFPLFLLLLSLAIPPILWAGQRLIPDLNPDYYVLGLAALSDSPALALLVYLGGISAASAMIIVETLALSSLTLNHLLLPLMRPRPERDLYAGLRGLRRLTIAALIGAGYLFYELLERSQGLVAWGLISFLAMAQFLPGIVGVLYWSRATRAGFIAGLLGGGAVWALGALLPALSGVDALAWLTPEGGSRYSSLTFWSLSLNTLLFVGFSLVATPTPRERLAALACREVSLRVPLGAVRLTSTSQFVDQLAPVLGEPAARHEVERALADLGLDAGEARPAQLQLLRDQLERNLSGMVGPVVARSIVDARLAVDGDARAALAQSVRLMEERLEGAQQRFRGVAAELDTLRRYHRQVLEDLPVGVAALSPDGRIIRWNPAMAAITATPEGAALGRRLPELPPPWGEFLATFLAEEADQVRRRPLRTAGRARYFSLHRTAVAGDNGGTLLLVEDVTELQLLERELLHSERLASIGRLAAGVAHEIGNPVTAIACLAQDLRQEDDPGRVAEVAEQVLQQTHRIGNIVHTLVSYAHAGGTGREHGPVALSEVVEEARRVVQLARRAQAMRFELAVPPELRVRGDRQRLVQVFVNLLSNAADACEGKGRIAVSAEPVAGRACITVADSGPGIPEEIRDQVLEPFFTTKPAGEGTGLGLPLVYNIVQEHGGELRLDSDASGTRVHLALPLDEN